MQAEPAGSVPADSLPRRTVTAVVVISVMVASVFALPTAGFAVVVAVFAVGAGLEWSRITARKPGAGFGPALLIAGSIGLLWLAGRHEPAWLLAVCIAALGWWCVALFWVVRFERGFDATALDGVLVSGLAGWFVVVPTWAGLVYLHGSADEGPWRVMFVLLIVWTADIGAYFAGRRFGARRLAARISPGKSVEGVAGGMGAVAAVGAAAGFVLGLPAALIALFAVLCVGVAALSVLGDLTESLVKRRSGVKDSGSVLPGHGGVLDRIDSLTAAAPAFVIGLEVFGSMR